MSRKDLSVTVELDVHTVKCQGVWLCPKGDVTLRICTLECTARTSKKPPVFPIPYNEKFVFQKTFSGVFCLVDLQHQLAKEIFCAELTQWPENTLGIVLAKFETTLEELLFPKSVQKENVPGVDAELLMEPEHTFPGIISPKIHVSAKITVGESVNEHLQKINSSLFHSRHMWHGKYAPLSSLQNHAFRRQKRVCHSKDSAAHLYKHAWKMVDGKIPISKSPTGTPLLPTSPVPEGVLNDLPDDDYKAHVPVCCTVCNKYRKYFSETYQGLSDAVCDHQYPVGNAVEDTVPKGRGFQGDTYFKDCMFHKPYLGHPQDLPEKYISTVDHLSQYLDSDQEGHDEESYRGAFYEALEKFYCTLYERTKLRARQERKLHS
ncbi:spermatogenesis-associated protein 6 isoform X2 [Anabrus simplex]|uniref:spermatogenesis-associated protein 6 isoform X2 n=1 Tax=Anabrus simplex TaxID=316456 RepID=UPI0035A30B10